MKKHREQGRTAVCSSLSAPASRWDMSADARRQKNVSRCAVFGPMPGNRPNSAASRSTASGTSATPWLPHHVPRTLLRAAPEEDPSPP